MPEWITQLDFNLLYRIQDGMRCGFLDFLMPKITLLGNSGALWIIITVVLLFPKKIPQTWHPVACRVADRRRRRQSDSEKSVHASPSVLAGSLGPPAHFGSEGLRVSLRSHPVLGRCRNHSDGDQPALCLGGNPACGADLVFKALPLCALSKRRRGGGYPRYRNRLSCPQNRQTSAPHPAGVGR